jgi:DNA-binding GntR family transcriptional regulator
MSDRSNKVAAIIREAIVKHRLRPGDKLVEREVVEAVGVSRIVVRQALIRLSEEGLVAWHANRGASVASPDFTEIVALFDALTSIEQSVIDHVGDLVHSEAWSKLRRHAEHESDIAHRTTREPEADITANFHILFVALRQNRFIIEFHEKLVRRVVLLNAIYRLEDRGKTLIHDHGKLLDFIETRKMTKAKELVARHYADILRSYNMKTEVKSSITLQEALAV